MGLINYLTATSLDQDYAHVAERRAADPDAASPKRSSRWPAAGALAVLAVFGLLVTTAFVQTSRTSDDAKARHDQLVKQVVARKAQLASQRERAGDLRSEAETLQTVYLQATAQGRSLQSRLTTLGVTTGADPATGPGVTVVVDNGPTTAGSDAAVLDVDLQKLVNGLWLSGAEAIAINNQRLTSLTAIRSASELITVNLVRLSPPYTVRAIGDPDQLAARFIDTPGGQWWLDLQALYGLKFAINSEESLTLPAASRLVLRHAHTPETLK